MRKFLKSNEVIELLKDIKEREDIFYDRNNHTLYNYNLENKQNNLLRLPLAWPVIDDWKNYIDLDRKFIFVIVIIQAGQATIGVFNQNLDVFEHKVLRTYMVRKKQGKSQLKYLKTKGKSRAGSRIRLKNTYLFFEDINIYLQRWFKEYSVDRIIYHIPTMMKNLWKSSKVDIPFDLDSEKCLKSPFNIKSPTFEEMKKIAKFSLDGEIKNEIVIGEKCLKYC